MRELPDNIVDIDKLNERFFKDLNRDWDGVSSDTQTPVFISAPRGAGKTETVKAIARQLGLPITEINLKDLMGPPPGYQGDKPTPEERAALKKSMDEMKADFALAASIQNGEELAAACHSGLSTPATPMKPLRLCAKVNSSFTSVSLVMS